MFEWILNPQHKSTSGVLRPKEEAELLGEGSLPLSVRLDKSSPCGGSFVYPIILSDELNVNKAMVTKIIININFKKSTINQFLTPSTVYVVRKLIGEQVMFTVLAVTHSFTQL